MLEEWIRGGKQSTGLSWFQSKKGKTVLVIVVSVGLLAILWPVGQITPHGFLQKPASDRWRRHGSSRCDAGF